MQQNDQCEINFWKTDKFCSNFEVKNDWLKGSSLLKCDQKKCQKIKRDTRLNYANYSLIKMTYACSIWKLFAR